MSDLQHVSLGRGLAVLELLVRSDRPLSASEIGASIGVHQTTASRILADLIHIGYVRRVSYREFEPDYGLLILGLNTAPHFPILDRPRLVLEHAARMCLGLQASLAMYWHRTLLYVDQAARGTETRVFNGTDFPMHLSSPGLLFLMALPEPEAIAALHASRAKFGWAQPTAQVPPTESELLHAARRLHQNGIIVLSDWQETGHVSAAIRLPDVDGIPVAAALSGPTDIMTIGTIRLRLQEIARMLTPSLRSLGRHQNDSSSVVQTRRHG